MGCDIHAYVEYLSWKNEDREYWDCLIAGAGGRDYALFGLLAGVRRDVTPVVAPRGMPEGEMSSQVRNSYHLRVSEEYKDHEGYTSPERADEWVRKGYSTELIVNETVRYVTGPDWHTASWLTADELAQVLGRYMFEVGRPYNIEWDAILAAMKAFEERGVPARLVFWFDN